MPIYDLIISATAMKPPNRGAWLPAIRIGYGGNKHAATPVRKHSYHIYHEAKAEAENLLPEVFIGLCKKYPTLSIKVIR